MIMKRWQLVLATSAAGACLALGVGSGIAAADPGTAQGESSGQSASRAGAAPAQARGQSAAERRAARQATTAPPSRTRSQAHRPDFRDAGAGEISAREAHSAAAAKPLPRRMFRTPTALEPGESSSTDSRTPGPLAGAMLKAMSTLAGSSRPAAVKQSPVTVPSVDLDEYLGTWYEVGSVKQFFSIGLVNTTAVYGQNADGSIKVENSGNYFFNNPSRSPR